MDIITYILIGLVGVWLGYTLAKRNVSGSPKSAAPVPEQTEEKENNKNRILVILGSKGQITNNEVEEALSVSDATATRYLNELEEEGAIKQVGDTGRGVYYVPTGHADSSQ